MRIERSDQENAESAKLFQRMRSIVDSIAGSGGVAIEEIQVMLSHDREAQNIVQRLQHLGFSDSEIERQIFGRGLV